MWSPFCSQPIPRSNSGAIYCKISCWWRRIIPRIGFFDSIIFENSSRTRSIAMRLRLGACFLIASLVSVSMVKSNSVASRTARMMRSASSLNRSFATPTARIVLSPRSCCPLKKSKMSCFIGSYAIAFTVKSRRFKSSSSFLLKVTLSGRRLSEYFSSIRYGVTSTTLSVSSFVSSCTIPTVPYSFS